jgi:exopolyphosphatase/pppGpp-phosphohydrolase
MDALKDLQADQLEIVKAITALGLTCGYEAEHTEHVTRLSLRIFDDLQKLHKLNSQHRFWLICAGLLHDIGWSEGWRGHHKIGLRIIQETPMLPFDSKERLLIGSIARYHRQALPNLKHDHYAALESEERMVVDKLAAFLRLADGLDRTHRALVRDLACKYNDKKIVVHCASRTPAREEAESGKEKGYLLEKVFKRKLVIRWRSLL